MSYNLRIKVPKFTTEILLFYIYLYIKKQISIFIVIKRFFTIGFLLMNSR